MKQGACVGEKVKGVVDENGERGSWCWIEVEGRWQEGLVVLYASIQTCFLSLCVHARKEDGWRRTQKAISLCMYTRNKDETCTYEGAGVAAGLENVNVGHQTTHRHRTQSPPHYVY